jgi:hypothetical protein
VHRDHAACSRLKQEVAHLHLLEGDHEIEDYPRVVDGQRAVTNRRIGLCRHQAKTSALQPNLGAAC